MWWMLVAVGVVENMPLPVLVPLIFTLLSGGMAREGGAVLMVRAVVMANAPDGGLVT